MKVCFASILGIVWSTGVFAGPYKGIHPLLSDRFVLGVMGFWPDLNASIAVDDPNGGIGTDVDLDKLFGSSTDFRLALGGVWRISERSKLNLEWFSLNNSGKFNIDETIEWDDVEYQAGVKLSGSTSFDVYRFFYGYNLIRGENKEFGIGAGLHLMNLQAELSGNATVNGAPIGKAKRGVDVWAPLPNIGAYGNYAFSPKWLVSGQVDWFSANVGDYDGSLWHVGVAVQYQVSSHFGIGAGYRYLNLDVNVDKKDEWKGKANNSYGGPMIFATLNF